MKKAAVLITVVFLACPTFAANESREQKRLATCGQVFKEIMNIPDGIPKDLLNKAECVIVIPFSTEVRDRHRWGLWSRCDHLPHW